MGLGGISIIVGISTHVHFDEKSQDLVFWHKVGFARGPTKSYALQKTTHLWDIFGKWHYADHWFDELKSIGPQAVSARAILLGREC